VKTLSARAINNTMLIAGLTRRRVPLKQFMTHGGTPPKRVAYSRSSNPNSAGFVILHQFLDDACCGQ
jgi:hypothetical protein